MPRKTVSTHVPTSTIDQNDQYLIDTTYEADSFIERIRDEYGDPAGWTNITLSRREPGSAKYAYLDSFAEPPSLQSIKTKWGGGDYRLFIQWKNSPDYKNASGEYQPRGLDTKIFLIAGKSKLEEDNTLAAVPVNGQHPVNENPPVNKSLDLLDTIKILKELGLIGTTAAAPASNDSASVVEAIKSNGKITEALITASLSGKNNDDYKQLVETLVKGLMNKQEPSDLTGALKIVDAIDSRSAGKEPGMLDTVKDVVSMIPAIKAMGGDGIVPGAGLNSSMAALGAPGGPVNPLQGILNRINQGFQSLGSQINALSSRVDNIEKNVEWDAPPVPAAPVNPSGEKKAANVIEMPGHKQTEPDPNEMILYKERQISRADHESNLKQSELLKTLSPPDQAIQLNSFLMLFPMSEVYSWCIDYGVIDNVEAFNEIMILAGQKEYHPGPVSLIKDPIDEPVK